MKTNLIGISGKIGSGKDTVGSVFQWIVTSKTGFGNGTYSNKECVEWLNGKYPGDTTIQEISGYQIKKFADEIKDTVSRWIGCTREDLEDREFKEKELGEEWWVWKSIFKNLPAYNNIHRTEHEAKNWVKFNKLQGAVGDYHLVKLTPRKLLQLLGTECGRQIIHPNIWVNALFADYVSVKVKDDLLNEKTKEASDKLWKIGHLRESKWIITDVRFPNEAQAIKDRGGVVIRVNRPYIGLPSDYKPSEHPSETALDDYEFDHVIDNNGSIEELVEKVKQLNLV